MSLVKALVSPFFIILTIFLIGYGFLFSRTRRRSAQWLLAVALFSLSLLGFRPFSNFLLWGLERSYPPLTEVSQLKGPCYIVVLTAWDSDNTTVPYTSNLGYGSALRLLEAHRIYMSLPESVIVISGSEVGTRLMAKFAGLLGVPAEKIIIDDKGRNTKQSAITLRSLVSSRPLVLVTSALHLPRAMRAFEEQGLNPVPAPADFRYGYYREFDIPLRRDFSYFIPNIASFEDSHAALYEYSGVCWYTLRTALGM